jgi:ribosomal protein S18 acetylase RimI-like enzyme
MIYSSNQLTSEQLQQLEKLAAQCKKSDGSTPNLYTHILSQPRALPAGLLYYKQNLLIGFLSAFFFYDEAVEISLLIHPKHRKQGIAKELIRTILPLVYFQNYFSLIFSTPTGLNNKWLSSQGYTYLHSEYYMEREDRKPLLDNKPVLTFRKATTKDIPILCSLDEACFPQRQGDLQERFDHVMSNREYEVVVALNEHKIIGKAHIRWQTKGATLSDIAINPSYQGSGLGTSLISHCINYALSEGKPRLNLDVETHNKRALNLYTRLGFITQNACDFWSISTERLSQILYP